MNMQGFFPLAMSIANLFVPIGLYKIRSYQVSDVNGEFSSREYIGFLYLYNYIWLSNCICLYSVYL